MRIPHPSVRAAAVIFDLDGVLVDSEPLHARTWLEVLRPLGFIEDERWFDRWIGIPDEDLASHLEEHKIIPVSAAEILRRKRHAFREAVSSGQLQPFAGVAQGLRLLAAAGLTLAVASNSRTEVVAHILNAIGLARFFPTVIGADRVRCPKPAPDIFTAVAQRIGVETHVCVVVEDSPAGITAAIAAHCRVYGVTTTHCREHLLAAHDILPDTASAIARILQEQGA